MRNKTLILKAAFAAGCFWHVEEVFRKAKGVITTTVGYTGGKTNDPTYEQVCSGITGHAEAVEVTYDQDKVSYEELLNLFWSIHNPTTLNRQGPDVGTQYRSAIFYYTPEQKKTAIASKEQEQKKYNAKIVTKILAAGDFYPAEAYHQQYYDKKCRI